MTLLKTGSPSAPSASTRRRGGPRLQAWRARLLITPMSLYVVLFFVAPLILLLVYSLGRIDVLTFEVSFGWTLDNYRALVDGVYVGAIVRSLALTVTATLVCVAIGFPVALAISRLRGPLRTLCLVGVVVPYWISFVVRTYAWLDLLAPNGLVNEFLTALHLIPDGTELRYTTFAIAVGMVYGYLPLMILPIYVALERIDPAMIEAGYDLGLGRAKVFWKIIVPLAMPGTIAGALLVGIPATGEYTIPAILGGEKTLMAGNVAADQFLGTGNFPFGAAIGSALMAIMLVVMFLSRRRLDQLEDIA
ncbi:spermidine/putrescine transport system permease protein [Actinocorallia herbida]|uniref:Spermidine/putrescine transport system permease protein n=1 Tax=Actinocorallia herbida TaxID=58109 RepID=A0A3N1CY89_9ACTN|nr:ABC transporter permease [Actinocorallia herbida]ROO86259.1 spermidine/putrescine transport system permease protein [Actinocorallia herbida]